MSKQQEEEAKPGFFARIGARIGAWISAKWNQLTGGSREDEERRSSGNVGQSTAPTQSTQDQKVDEPSQEVSAPPTLMERMARGVREFAGGSSVEPRESEKSKTREELLGELGDKSADLNEAAGIFAQFGKELRQKSEAQSKDPSGMKAAWRYVTGAEKKGKDVKQPDPPSQTPPNASDRGKVSGKGGWFK